MKKQLLGVALSALLISTAAEARHFDGGTVGATVGYGWQSMKFKDAASPAVKASIAPAGLDVGLNAGYAEKVGSLLLGGDVRAGLGFASKKKSLTLNGNTGNVKVTQDWLAGVGAIVGGEFARNWLGFFRLGVDYVHYKTNTTTVISGKKFGSWAVVPGVGVKMKVTHSLSVDAMYEYSHGFSAKNPSSTVKFDEKPTSNNIKIGISYYL
ncbi:MAG: hypothetical protein A2977_03985 [Alphaproteobacteria bacterium RIFCSPLOWO2_01_FULL_45_8]|nr:MAG: hypothetical protein A2065_03150 [Alphaproteobacteria bacterium GWB1_45_5]OFW76640.1 MAG: hypothetical protein A3K20_00465 [Alphaproteobacteria bacterium GWA1_45_9]OFW89725.1 MAG: hypothetical protein A2621_02355 [Alphaproteobacteria bacterium RIFCSPHIGHO2_01_FULL_41_14]OFW96382.1 MAG: hypothetical protein A2977_03985 [Alphaproteobacteria bacterium RIFCSPLOWO2_01_FULL_45_8]HCI49170.1 hypothetical protein [Holosporales bacterium]